MFERNQEIQRKNKAKFLEGNKEFLKGRKNKICEGNQDINFRRKPQQNILEENKNFQK